MATPFQVVIDCADPAKLSEFWAGALHYVVQPPPEGYDSWQALLKEMGVPESEWNSASAIVDPDGEGPRIFLQRVPEPKSIKNRWHLDISAGGIGTPEDERRPRVQAEVERLVELGATKVEEREARGERWVLMLDPEGNEFDVQ